MTALTLCAVGVLCGCAALAFAVAVALLPVPPRKDDQP